jgi:SSS family solute:Na+ symporter
MNFNWYLDGSIVGIYLLVTMVAGLAARKYVGKVEDFLVAGREMNLHLGIASLAAAEFGVVTCMYTAQNAYDKGFAGATPGILMALTMFLVGATGFCIEPMRKAGVITIPEFFEQRFGPRIRWLSGLVIVLGGLLNMGVFLRTGGEFLVFACGLNSDYLEITMTALLIGVGIYTVLGGMLSVLVTDYLQFVVMSVGLLTVTVLVLVNVGWDTLVNTVAEHYGPGGFNPFVNEQMGPAYVAFNALIAFAMMITWQTQVQRVLAAKDSRTGRRVYTHTSFFYVCRFVLPGIWAIAALATLPPETVGSNTSYAMPKYLGIVIPTGMSGLLIAAMLAADMSTDSAYMLTWGSVIYNDILAPLRRRQNWTQRFGLLVNRVIIAAIGIFLLIYGLWYPLKGDIWTYLGVTATIYLSSMSVLLIACCYWRRANNWGAAAAIIIGAVIPLAYLILELVPQTQPLAKRIGPYYSGIATYILAAMAMVVGSLLKPLLAKPSETTEDAI